MKSILILIAATLPLGAQVKIAQQGNQKIAVDIDGKPFTEFWIGPETHKPYLAPLRTLMIYGTGKSGELGFTAFLEVK